MNCICGKKLGKSMDGVTVVRRPCRCGLPDRRVVPGAPHVWYPARNPEREAAGLPDQTPWEKDLERECR